MPLKSWMLVCALACGVSCRKEPAKNAGAATTNAAAPGGNPLTAPADYLGAMGKAKKVAEKTVDSAGLQQAISMFHATEGRFPKDLQELVSGGVIGRIPEPPRGMKYQYDPGTGRFRIIPQ